MSLIVPTIDELVALDHAYRPMLRVLDFGKLTRPLGKLYSELGRGGYRIEQGCRCLLLQHPEDLSDVSWSGVYGRTWPRNCFAVLSFWIRHRTLAISVGCGVGLGWRS